jgi:hypothetical protein
MPANNLRPSRGAKAWRNEMIERFQTNAARCRAEAQAITDRQERDYTCNLARLWEQLAEAAQFQREFSR